MSKLFFVVLILFSFCLYFHDHDFLLVKPLISYSSQQLISPILSPTISLYLFSLQVFDASRAVSWTLYMFLLH